MNLSFWWERVAYTNAALERNPADRLAYKELAYLIKQKDIIIAEYGNDILWLFGAVMQESMPQ